jgi:hypothetical protein
MSKVAISGDSSGTGTFTIKSPNSSTDRTLDLPDAAGTIQVSGNPISGTTGSFSGDLSFNSGYGSAAVAYGCRAWVNFDGTGTPAIRASGNVSSITDLGTGQFTVNFATAMPDINYAPVATCTHAVGITGDGTISFFANPLGTVSAVSFYTTHSNGTTFDPFCVAVAIFR